MRKAIVLALAAIALAGCALGSQGPQADSYDLGPVPARPATAGATRPVLMVPEVAAPAWLDGQGIVYRLSYENDSRPQAYANSRWVAPPASLLTQRLRGRFAANTGVVSGVDGTRADYVLRVDLEDFSQSFTSASASNVALRARASLVRLPDRVLVAQRAFSVERAAPTADARGAVTALGAASSEMIESLADWVGQQVRK
ncbi:MAG TPA: ABC-type transport auxiliary lipoprotein family protein [Burkholderiales bacterium]|nr:ABC-type transport auxiliary lipoprotein family protein [Burkholderiales bacterium]